MLKGNHRLRAGLLLWLLAALLAAALPAQVQAPGYPELDPNLEPLRSRFNRDMGKVRLILLLDPT